MVKESIRENFNFDRVDYKKELGQLKNLIVELSNSPDVDSVTCKKEREKLINFINKIEANYRFNSIENKKELDNLEYFTKELENNYINNLLNQISVVDFLKSTLILTGLTGMFKFFFEPIVRFINNSSTTFTDFLIAFSLIMITIVYLLTLAFGFYIEYKKHKNNIASNKLKYKTLLIAIDELKAELDDDNIGKIIEEITFGDNS